MTEKLTKQIDDIKSQFIEFSKQCGNPNSNAPRNRWLQSEDISLYLRKQLTIEDGEFAYHLCIGSIDISSAYQKQGVFTEIITYLEQNISHFRYISVECLMNEHLERYLTKRGYVPYKRPAHTDHYFDVHLTNKPLSLEG
ncbi:hypothetical protein [Photobacterium leiognathi]|uniref:hypothetical protein n=1 Tax=Photobacterium leiognathi TaxID=553611 RepID=UPI002982B2B3|nr:hypothetical protein [Photobacterium leiognathi]